MSLEGFFHSITWAQCHR